MAGRKGDWGAHLRREVLADGVKDDTLDESLVTIETPDELCGTDGHYEAPAVSVLDAPKFWPDQMRTVLSSPTEAR